MDLEFDTYTSPGGRGKYVLKFGKRVNLGITYYSSSHESEDREVWSFSQSHTNLSYLALVPNFRIQYQNKRV